MVDMMPSSATTLDGKMAETAIVQRLLKPDPGINSEYPLFFHHGDGYAGFDNLKDGYFVQRGAWLRFDSYFNSFPAHLYHLQDRRLGLNIKATGEFFLLVVMARHERSWEHLYHAKLQMREGDTQYIEFPENALDGLVYVEVIALRETVIYEMDYLVTGAPSQDAGLTAVITTFKRNDAIQSTCRRLQTYFNRNQDLLDKFTLLVIDNGGETDSIPFTKGRVIKNRNLGGAGGFTRGLYEAQSQNLSTHVLFMDDDASFFPESLRRTLSVLRFSKSEKLAVSGAMITESHKWRMWENGATFDQACRPIDNGRDLRSFHDVMPMSLAQPRHLKNKFAGWWYFCFPIAQVKTWPFPFFVRGDDSYFSLSNDFDIITMPGVVAHQEDFFTKQTPLTVYLDMRYHIVHHLTFEDLDIGSAKLQRMVARYFNRFNNSYHYESARAILHALEDVLSEPKFWEENVDMAEKRKQIAALTVSEKLRQDLDVDISKLARHSPRRNTKPLVKLLRELTRNGHLMPEHFFYKKGVLFPLDARAIEHDTYLRPYTVTFDQTTGKGYLCKMDRKAYFENLKRFKVVSKQLARDYKLLRQRYNQAKSSLTAKEAWEKRFEEIAPVEPQPIGGTTRGLNPKAGSSPGVTGYNQGKE